MTHSTNEKKSENEWESKKESEGEGNFESEGDEDEKESESDGIEHESDEENTSGESEGSMAIGNIVMAPLEEVHGEERTEESRPSLNPFTGDEEVNNDEDYLPLSDVGEKGRKAPMRSTKPVPQTRKEVDPPASTSLTRSKRKPIDE
ncbi:uncharacterized protein [Nicotiana sylvestris]|uniref:uncharacterized protein n=1 Tax=Nicotiana sylvestris TaxID=4096 RepID=UPI00388C617C